MALKPIFTYGPDFGDARWVRDSEVDDLAFAFPSSLVATTAVSAHASSGEECFRWLKLASTGGNHGLIREDTVTLDTYIWAVIRAGVVEGSFATNDRRRIFRIGDAVSQFDVFLNFDDSDTYHYEIVRVSGSVTVGVFTTTTDLNDISPAFRVQWDGTRIKGWVEGSDTPEFDNAETGKPANRAWRANAGSLQSGEVAYYAGLGLWHSNDESDRPGYAIKHWHFSLGTQATPPVITESTAEYSSDGDGTCADTSGTGEDLQLDSNRDTDEGTNICMKGDVAGRIIMDSSTGDGTITGTGIGLTVYTISKANLATKTVTAIVRLEEGPFAVEDTLSNMGGDVFVSHQAYFPEGPAGVAWSDATATGLDGIGIRSVDTNGANDEHAALGMFFTSVDNDPPVVGTAARNLIIT